MKQELYLVKQFLVKQNITNKSHNKLIVAFWSRDISHYHFKHRRKQKCLSHSRGYYIIISHTYFFVVLSIPTKKLCGNSKYRIRQISVKFLTFNITFYIIDKLFLSMEPNLKKKFSRYSGFLHHFPFKLPTVHNILL